MPKSMVGVFLFVACFILFGIYAWINFIRFNLYAKAQNTEKWKELHKSNFVKFIKYLFDGKVKEAQEIEAYKSKIKVGLMYAGLSFIALVINSLIVFLIEF